MSNCKPGKSYPFKLKRMKYTSPTSGHTRIGTPSLHCDRSLNKEFTMVRAKGGRGTKRDYAWKQHFKPA